jgi:hypothetical protein
LVGIYGGTLEVFRNMIAQYVLGLGKPAYAPPAQERLLARVDAKVPISATFRALLRLLGARR